MTEETHITVGDVMTRSVRTIGGMATVQEAIETMRGAGVSSLVVEARAREILETIAAAGKFDEEPGAGIAFEIAIEDAVGLKTQTATLLKEIEEDL